MNRIRLNSFRQFHGEFNDSTLTGLCWWGGLRTQGRPLRVQPWAERLNPFGIRLWATIVLG